MSSVIHRKSSFRDVLVLPAPTLLHQKEFNPLGERINQVVVENFLARALRPHQRVGVVFLYECLMGMRGPKPGRYQGALLADDMGLGKTLQCVAIVWTLLKQRLYGSGSDGEIYNVLILAPKSLCDGWERDFNIWLGPKRILVYKIDSKTPFEISCQQKFPVVIMSYEKYARRAYETVNQLNWDLLICDEAHLLKNPNTQKSKHLKEFHCKRRIMLTGSPCQNNLLEFYELLDLTNPGCMGSKQDFTMNYSMPIELANNPDCSEEERLKGERCVTRLRDHTSWFMLRRTSEINIPYLPSKQDLIVLCRMTKRQKLIYKEAVKYWEYLNEDPESQESASTLKAITIFRQISSHPALLKHPTHEQNVDNELQNHLLSKMNKDCNVENTHYSGKLQVVQGLLEYIVEKNKFSDESSRDRVLIISHFTQALDMLEVLCKRMGCTFCRLDGHTAQEERLQLIQNFNYVHADVLVFLLSAHVGGAGLNLTGASRLVLFEPDWNPANDAQSLARVWRGNQARPVITYRLLSAETIEERMFQRQIKKAVLNPTLPRDHPHPRFFDEDLEDLFSYHDDVNVNLTHEMLGCLCDGNGTNLKEEDSDDITVDCILPGIDELMHWQHFGPCIEPDVLQEMELLYAADKLTFVFRTEIQNDANSVDTY